MARGVLGLLSALAEAAPPSGALCQHEACSEVYDSDTRHSAPVIAIAWALSERSADGPHGSNERRRFRPLARAFLHDLLRDRRRAEAVRDFLAARLTPEPTDDLGARIVAAAIASGPNWCGKPESHPAHDHEGYPPCPGVAEPTDDREAQP
jgi:hypothetical protein